MMELNSKAIHKLLTKPNMKSIDLIEVIRDYKIAKNEERKEHFKNIIFENIVKLIWKIASKRCYGLPGINFEDAFQYGVLGFCDGLERFELKKNTMFSTYITWWIDKYILDYFYSSSLLYVPKNVIREYRKCNRLIGDYVKENGPEKIDEFIDKSIRTKTNHWDRFKHRHLDAYSRVTGGNILRIDESPSSGNSMDKIALKETIKDDSVIDALDVAIDKTLIERINEIMDKFLNEKERRVIKYRYLGNEFLKLDDVAGMIFKENGDSITRERVRQLEETAIIKLKRHLAKQHWGQ